MKKNTCGVYQITAPSGNFYIGSSFCMRSRWSGHRVDLRKGSHHCAALQHASNKHGIDSLRFSILLVCDRDNARFYEQLAIDAFQPEYNSTDSTREPLSGLWQDPEFRKAGVDRCREQAIQWRKSPEWVANQKAGAGAALARLHTNPEFKKAHAERIRERIIRVNETPGIRAKADETRRTRMAEDKADPERWAARNAKIRELLETPVLCVETGAVFKSQKEAGNWLNVEHGFKSSGHINNNLKGRCKQAYGFTWQYAEVSNAEHR
jgi:group I intron endonuclease